MPEFILLILSILYKKFLNCRILKSIHLFKHITKGLQCIYWYNAQHKKKKQSFNPFIPLAPSSPANDYSRCELNVGIFAIRPKDNTDHI